MKKILIALALTTVALVACNKSDDGGGSSSNSNNNNASTPQPCNGTTVTSNCYYNNQYQQNFCHNGYSSCSYGGWQFPTVYNPGYGNCGCNYNYMPVYGGFGYACAPQQSFFQFQVRFYGNSGFGWWNYGQNNRWLNNYQNNYGGNSCASSTAQGCDVRLQNCGGGYRCQPVGGGSTIGLCVRPF